MIWIQDTDFVQTLLWTPLKLLVVFSTYPSNIFIGLAVKFLEPSVAHQSKGLPSPGLDRSSGGRLTRRKRPRCPSCGRTWPVSPPGWCSAAGRECCSPDPSRTCSGVYSKEGEEEEEKTKKTRRCDEQVFAFVNIFIFAHFFRAFSCLVLVVIFLRKKSTKSKKKMPSIFSTCSNIHIKSSTVLRLLWRLRKRWFKNFFSCLSSLSHSHKNYVHLF